MLPEIHTHLPRVRRAVPVEAQSGGYGISGAGDTKPST